LTNFLISIDVTLETDCKEGRSQGVVLEVSYPFLQTKCYLALHAKTNNE